MQWIMRLLAVLALVMIAVWGIWFASKNTSVIALDLVFLQLPAASVSVWLAGAFALGGALGVGLSLLMIARMKAQEIRLNRKVQRFERQLDVSKPPTLANP